MRKSIFIVGPTAVGKTDLAFQIYKKIPSILISADSIQVYRGADIISGKDTTFPTFLIDVVEPTESFSVRDFVELVRPLVKKAESEHKIPIIVGGTGFYIDALFGKIETILVPPNEKLRTELDTLSVAELQEKLKKTNRERFEKMNNSDANNKRRLIRAIEVLSVSLSSQRYNTVFRENEVLIIGLKASMDSFRKKIIERVDKRIENGALKEAEELFGNYSNLSPQLKNANGYKELFEYLLGQTSLEEAKKRWIISEGQLAKDQMTWFKKRKNINWYDISEVGFENKIFELIEESFIVPGRE